MKYLNAILCPVNAFLLCNAIHNDFVLGIVCSSVAMTATLIVTILVISNK